MAEYIVTPLGSLENQTSAIQVINENFDDIKESLDDSLSRKFIDAANYLETDLDMNYHRVMNLGPPEASADAVRWIDITGGFYLTGMPIPSVVGNNGKRLATDGATLFWAAGGSGDVIAANNLSDLTSATTARTNLGLGTAAVVDVGTTGTVVPVLSGNNTHSGSNIFSGSVSLTGGVIFSGTSDVRLSVAGRTSLSSDSVGYLGAPQKIRDLDFTLGLDEAGSGVTHTSALAHTWTIPTNAAVAFPIHTQIPLDNSGIGVVSVVPAGGVTLRSNGSGTSGTKTLNQYFVQVLYKVGTDTWVWL